MIIRAIVFDIGGVLEITPDLGISTKWEQQLQLKPGELDNRLRHIWRDGSLGILSEEEVHQHIGQTMDMSEAQVNAFMDDLWQEYLGAPNTELMDYVRNLRPTYQTALLSNSFVGARRKEQERYQFDTLCDFIIYSHEVGMSKPDQRIYALTCERLGRQPAEVIFVDDREEAVEAAREFGLCGIVFKANAQIIADIQAYLQANAPSVTRVA
jgi:putative hydrolase of the HAD superfamily